MNNEHAWMEDGFYSAVPIRPKAQVVLLLYLQNTDPMGFYKNLRFLSFCKKEGILSPFRSFGLFLHSGTHILSLVLKTKDYQTPKMKSIVNNVHFNVVAREWRCKWDAESSLVECQTALTTVLDQVKDVKGVKDVQRVVCGGCKDFKVRHVELIPALLKILHFQILTNHHGIR
jgi:hypothetical protein